MTERIRNGHGHRAYRRKAEQVKHRAMKNGTPCAWCGQPFDWSLPPLHAMAFTADHVQAIINGGSLLGDLQPMHRSCNARKGGHAEPNIRGAS